MLMWVLFYCAAVCDVRSCLVVSMWHLQRNAWDVVAFMFLCVWQFSVVYFSVSPLVVLPRVSSSSLLLVNTLSSYIPHPPTPS